MRKSTMLVLLMLVGAFALLMYLANSSLGMWRPDIEAAQQLTRRWRERGDLHEGSSVKLRRVESSKDREGPGLNVEVRPAQALLARDGGLTALVRGLALEALSAYPADMAQALRWFKVTIELPDGQGRVVHLDRPPDGSLVGPSPALPRTFPEKAPAAPLAPPTPAIPGPAGPAGPAGPPPGPGPAGR
jgi:hypothetical protein